MSTSINLHKFHGGIHPAENKSQSTQSRIKQLALPSKLVLPLRQHSGSAAEPVVNVGEHVLKGQLIASAKGARSANLHAPTSGNIVAIEPHIIAHSSGLTEVCIVLEADNKEEWTQLTPLLQEGQDFTQQQPTDLLEVIRAAGVVGLGGAGFPTATKLASQYSIDTFILNAAECEPYITADDMLMRERAEEVVVGAAMFMYIVGAKAGLIGIEDNKPEAIAALSRAIDKLQLTQLQVVVIPTIYPSGSEKQLIKILTGKEVPTKGIPAQIGVLCQNVGTAAAAYQAVYHGKPLISRITTLTGNAISQIGNYEILIGTPLSFALEQAGYKAQRPERVIAGGPLMGFALPDLNVSISKTSNCFLAPTSQEIPLNDFAMECIRCGQCVEACPQELLPQQLYWFSKAQDLDKANDHNIMDCIECGACSYVCPSHIPLVQYYRHTKGEIRAEAAATAKAERAKERYENRNARIERLAAEREAQRQARAEAKARAEAEAAEKAAIEAAQAEQAPAANAEAVENLDEKVSELERKILAQADRVKKSQERFEAAAAEGLDTAPILENALQKQQDKLSKLEEELAALQTSVKEA